MRSLKIPIGGGKTLDLDSLIATRLLIEGGSGSGKSYRIRWLLELTYDYLPQIILDLEGEFYTLREKFDYVLVGKEGCDVNIDYRGAKTLARKILELNTSVIIDLYEYEPWQRIRFVKDFLDALIDMPKELYAQRLIVVDETHQFAPQQGKSESLNSVINLATRGRKRGLCAVFATQRPSKLHKDAAAECLNKMVGRMGQDIDMKRAYEDLGFTTKEQYYSIRQLKPGTFFGFGPAISNEIITLPPCLVKTSHPTLQQRTGAKRHFKKPTPTKKVKAILTKLADLPHQTEEELKSLQDYQQRIKELKYELSKKPRQKETTTFDEKKFDSEVRRVRAELQKEYSLRITALNKALAGLSIQNKRIRGQLSTIITSTNSIGKLIDYDIEQIIKREKIKPVKFEARPVLKPKPQVERTVQPPTGFPLGVEDYKPRAGARRMLKALASFHPQSLTHHRLSLLSGISTKGGSFSTYTGELKRGGYIVEEQNGDFTIMEEGLRMAGDVQDLPTDHESILSFWKSKFRKGARTMLELLAEVYPDSMTKDELSENSGVALSSGSFSTYLGELKRNGLAEVNGQEVRATKELMGDG